MHIQLAITLHGNGKLYNYTKKLKATGHAFKCLLQCFFTGKFLKLQSALLYKLYSKKHERKPSSAPNRVWFLSV
jgi:hypothetical protein